MNQPENLAGQAPSVAGERKESPLNHDAPERPISIYEVHPGSWMRVPEEQNRPLTGPELAPKLTEHVRRMNFTHVHIHSPAGIEPQELEFLVRHLRQHEVGVILEKDDLAGLPAEADGLPPVGRYERAEAVLSGHEYHWDLDWAEETAAYFSTDPLYRKFRQMQFTHRDGYAFDHNFILPFSDRLVTRPRSSLFKIMPGDAWQKFANLRLLYIHQFLLPGKKLIFMGNEFGQQNPWIPESSLDWHLLNEENHHRRLMNWVARLNAVYQTEPALHETDSQASGFQWVDTSDATNSVISFLRRSADGREVLLAVLNFTPVPRHNYRVGAPKGGFWSELLNSDATEFGGSGQGNLGGQEATPFGWNFQSHSLTLTLPPLAGIVLKGPA